MRLNQNFSRFNQALEKIDDFSTFLSLIALILAIQSSQIGRKNTSEQNRSQSEKIILVSVYIAACSNFIDLATAKAIYDRLINSDEEVDPKRISAAQDLLTSRVFSTIAVIYLIRATLKSEGDIGGIAAPTGTAGVP